MRRIFIISVLTLMFLAAPSFAATYDLDPDHTKIGFAVKHMVISNVPGSFGTFTGTFELDDSGKLVRAAATVQQASVNTGVEKRDNHLRSPDFFDVIKFPAMSFVSKKVTNHKNHYTVVGDLTIKNVTRSIILTGEMLGMVKDPLGNQRAGFHAEGKINRKDFGVNFHKVIEAGALVVGDEVKIILEIEGIMRKPGAANPCNPCGKK